MSSVILKAPMAILIVDDETSTRNALRDLLTQMGHKTILEAKNGEEALKTAEAEKSRIRLIIADWEMPYMDGITLLERIAAIPELDRPPFLLITSDLPRSKLAELQEKTDRLDAFLIKPFRMSALEQAMRDAQTHRAATRCKIVAFGASDLELSKRGAPPHWDPAVAVSTIHELTQAVSVHARRLGALVISPLAPELSAPLAEWLSAFVRTPLGAATPIVCASRDPSAIFPFRTLCQAFVRPESDWPAFWARLRGKESTSLTLELLFQELKSELQKKKKPEALKLCEKILALDPTSSDAQSTLGDLLDEQGQRAAAVAHYWSALESNPCLPKPYIRLLEGANAAQPDQGKAAVAAAAYCPQNPDVLFSAARAWIAGGDPAAAQELVHRILLIQPNHAGAKALLKPTS